MPDQEQAKADLSKPWGRASSGPTAGTRAAVNGQFPADSLETRLRPPRGLTVQLRALGIWLGIVILAVMAYGYRYEISRLGARFMAILIPGAGYSVDPQTVNYFADANGQFWIDGRVNDIGFRFLVDTGASSIVFNKTDARRLGFDVESLHFDRTAWTANGKVRYTAVRLREVTIGPVVMSDVPAQIDEGDLRHPLLGMAFLRRMSGFEITNGILTIHR